MSFSIILHHRIYPQLGLFKIETIADCQTVKIQQSSSYRLRIKTQIQQKAVDTSLSQFRDLLEQAMLT